MDSKTLHHVAIVVDDLDKAVGFWRDAMGLPLDKTEENDLEEVRIAFLPVGDSEIELLEPTTADSGIAKYIAKKGAGMHHLCFAVNDIEAAMQRIVDNGAELINETPRTRDDGTRYAFVHPKSTGGVLVELYEIPAS